MRPLNRSSTSAWPAASLVDPRTLMSIRNLELRARVVVEGFWTGLHRSPYHGFSVEFTEYRPYTPDDDPRYLDWRVFARSDRYFIKKFEDETNLRCYLLADTSRSMAYGSVGYTKAEYAATLAATLAYFVYLQGDAVGLLTFDQEIRDYLPARHRSGHLRQVMLALEKPALGRSTSLSAPLERIVEIVRKRSLVVLVSDFLAPLERLESDLIALSACGHEVIVFQVLDPAELALDFEAPAMFEDAESGRTLFIDPGAARKEYRRKLEAHCESLRAACQRLGIACQRLATDRPLELALFDFLRQRMQQKRRIRRVARTTAGRF
ncbi:MAG: DUF58 domain-containing protein [Verrucomicrobiota bacterium]|jgi:uncharacterized protein (DUF58 family)